MTEIAAIDMFVVETATFRLLYALIVLSHERRRVIHFDVTQYPTQDWLARQMTEAFPWDTAPGYLLRERDASYGAGFRDRVRVMGIKEVVTAPRSPWQNPYVERLIGSIRRECLDHIIIFNEHHLRERPVVVISSIIRAEHICRSTRIARRRAQYTRQPLARSLPSPRSVACIIATNDALHELSGRSNRPTRFGARGRSALQCIAQMQWRPKPMCATGLWPMFYSANK